MITIGILSISLGIISLVLLLLFRKGFQINDNISDQLRYFRMNFKGIIAGLVGILFGICLILIRSCN